MVIAQIDFHTLQGHYPMFDAVPFAGAGRMMSDGDGKTGVVCQLLQFDFP
jgi:hypothetical protein